jgi:hypothetical protein
MGSIGHSCCRFMLICGNNLNSIFLILLDCFDPTLLFLFISIQLAKYFHNQRDKSSLQPIETKHQQNMQESLLDPVSNIDTNHQQNMQETLLYSIPTIDADVPSPLESKKKAEPKTSGGGSRLHSLDTFRGISLTLMIFVNYGGGGYWWLDHSAWDGLTVADLLFPWFMWIMGVSMALALKSRRSANQSKGVMLKQIGSRALKLATIGLCLGVSLPFSTWRFPGVLQYFAFSYSWY